MIAEGQSRSFVWDEFMDGLLMLREGGGGRKAVLKDGSVLIDIATTAADED